jgi:hypothetical protein
MFMLGDTLAWLSIIAAGCLSGWALMVGCAIIFGRKAARAKATLEQRPWRALGLGLLVSLTAGLLSVVMMAAPNPLAKLAGMALAFLLLFVASLGASGVALMIANRIQPLDPNLSPFRTLARGSAIVVVAAIMPAFGWFFVLPLLIILSLGLGFDSLFHRVVAPPMVASPTS